MSTPTTTAIDPRIGVLIREGQTVYYAFAHGYDKPETVGTLATVEAALGLRPAARPSTARPRALRLWTVTVRLQYPAWDEVDGIAYTGIVAASKAEANRIVRRRAHDDGHTIGMRAWFTATPEND